MGPQVHSPREACVVPRQKQLLPLNPMRFPGLRCRTVSRRLSTVGVHACATLSDGEQGVFLTHLLLTLPDLISTPR